MINELEGKMKKPIKIRNSIEIINNTKAEILDLISDKLQEIITGNKEMEIYFCDLVSEVVDSNTPQKRDGALKLIEFCSNEKYLDKSIIDTSSTDRMLITTAYGCLEMYLFDDDFFQELQNDLNNEVSNINKAKKIFVKIKNYRQENNIGKFEPQDTDVQIYMTLNFELSKDDFKQPYFLDKQVIELGNRNFKVLTYCGENQKDRINKNAIVIEHFREKLFRVYLMDKGTDIDIRKYFISIKFSKDGKTALVPVSIIVENDYNLDPRKYINPKTKKIFSEKKEFIWFINQMSNKLVGKTLSHNQKKK